MSLAPEESAHDTKAFENERWASFTQPREFRHDAALSLVDRGPVLDIGCGDGLLLALFKERGIDAEGADISSEAIERCVEKGLVAREYDPAKPLPYANDAFETVVLLDVLEHVYEPEALLREAARVGKQVIVGVPNFSSLPARVQVLLGRVPENNLPHKGHVYWFNRDVLTRTAARAGLAETRLLMNTFRPFAGMNGIVRLAPNMLALSFVVLLERQASA